MFVICAFIFLTEIFLFVGGPLLVFSGRAYVDSTTSFGHKACDLQSIIYKLYFYVVGVFSVTDIGNLIKKGMKNKMKNITSVWKFLLGNLGCSTIDLLVRKGFVSKRND